jgi:hypothetical protein
MMESLEEIIERLNEKRGRGSAKQILVRDTIEEMAKKELMENAMNDFFKNPKKENKINEK